MTAARLGFVGCGTIAAAMIEGLVTAGHAGAILVSPRNAGIAQDLAARFAQVSVTASNQAVLDGSDLVILAVRPQIAREVIAQLRFDPRHRVLSVIAAVTLDYLRAATAPAAGVVRAVPLPAVARREGPTAVFPPDPGILALFGKLGTAIALESESDFGTFTAATSTMSSYFALAETLVSWMAARGVAGDQAHAFTASLLRALAGTPGASFAALADEHQTRGGLNEQVRAHLLEACVPAALEAALDGIIARLEAAA